MDDETDVYVCKENTRLQRACQWILLDDFYEEAPWQVGLPGRFINSD